MVRSDTIDVVTKVRAILSSRRRASGLLKVGDQVVRHIHDRGSDDASSREFSNLLSLNNFAVEDAAARQRQTLWRYCDCLLRCVL